MKIRPLHDRIIVKRLEEERKTASGIVIPDTAAEKIGVAWPHPPGEPTMTDHVYKALELTGTSAKSSGWSSV